MKPSPTNLPWGAGRPRPQCGGMQGAALALGGARVRCRRAVHGGRLRQPPIAYLVHAQDVGEVHDVEGVVHLVLRDVAQRLGLHAGRAACKDQGGHKGGEQAGRHTGA